MKIVRADGLDRRWKYGRCVDPRALVVQDISGILPVIFVPGLKGIQMQFVLFVAFYAGTGTLLVILLGLRNFLMKTVAGDWTRFAFATPVFLLTVVFVLVCGYWHLLVFRTVFDSLVSGWVKLLLFCLPFVWFGLIAALFNRKYGR